MIQKRRNILFVFMIFTILIAGYGINSQLEKVPYAIELSSETDSTAGGLQSDSDANEDENSNRVSQFICITENLSTSFIIKNPTFLKSHSYTVWQPPKNS